MKAYRSWLFHVVVRVGLPFCGALAIALLQETAMDFVVWRYDGMTRFWYLAWLFTACNTVALAFAYGKLRMARQGNSS